MLRKSSQIIWTLFIMLSVSIPFVSAFVYQQQSQNVTQTIINTSVNIESLYVDSFISITRQWTEVGSSPWLDAQDEPTNYIYASSAQNLHEEFTFQDLPGGVTNIVLVTLYLYCYCGTEEIQASIWNGIEWINLPNFAGSDWAWLTQDASSILDTVTKVNGAKLSLKSIKVKGWSGEVKADCAYLYVEYS